MTWNGYDPPRDEDRYEDSDDADYSWTDGQGVPDADDWKDATGWPEEDAGPEYWFLRGLDRDEDIRKRKQRDEDDTDPEQ